MKDKRELYHWLYGGPYTEGAHRELERRGIAQ